MNMNERTSKTKLLTAIAIFAMVVCVFAVAASAEDSEATDADTIEIDSNEDLVNAILNQSDNQTWMFTIDGIYDVFNPGNYLEDKAGLSSTDQKYGGYVPAETINGHVGAEYIFPIYADNITITKAAGVGDVVLTSSAVPADNLGGMWNYQNFITIAGNDVTIDGIDIKPNTNDYYEGVNKAIEILASGITLKDIEILPYSDENQFSGSITFNTTDLGDSTIDNVKLYGWISTNYPGTGTTAGTLTTTNVTIDFTDNIYAGYFYEGYGYGWCPGIHNEKSGANVENSGLVIVVDDDIAITEQILERLKSGTTIQLATDVDLNADATIGADVTFAGIGKLVIPAGLSLTVEDGITMTNDTTVENNGTVHNNGTIVNKGTFINSGTIDGEVSGEAIQDPSERPFTNTITLGDGAVIDASSSIDASYTQEVVIAGDVTISANGVIDIKGKLTIQDGAVLTIEQGGNIIIQNNGIVDIQGDLVVEAGTTGDESFQYGGCLMTVAGTVTLEGASSFATTSTAKGIGISGTFEVGNEATAVLNQAIVSEGGELLVYGVVTGTVENAGTITIDSQGLADDEVNMTVQLKTTGTVDITNVYGTIVVSDSELTFTEKKDEIDVDNDNTVTLKNVAGVTVTDNLDDDNKNHGINTMYVSGGISVADDYNSTPGITSSIIVAGDKVEIAEAVTLGKDVTMYIDGNLIVSGEVTAIDGVITGDGGSVTVTGKVTTADTISGATVNAALYQTERVGTNPVYNVYTTLGTALADGATDIDLLGKNVVDADITIPVGTTVDMVDATLTVEKDVTLTIASDDRKSGKLNTATGAVDTVIVDGTMEIQNFAKSGVKIDAVLSDTSKEVEGAMTFTNVYNALDNAADGETVKVTRGAGEALKLTLEQDVEIRSGVTLLIPADQIVLVDNGVTVTVNGTLVNQGTYDIADEIEDDEATPKNEYKAAGVTIVNGMMLYSNGDYTADIIGAYFEYTYEKTVMDAIAPLASLPAIADDIKSDVYLYGKMALGSIDFSAYDGEGVFETIYAVNDLTIESLTLGNVAFDASTSGAVVNGTIVLANGTVELDNVNGIIAENIVDEIEDTVTSVISGNVIAVQNEDIDGDEKAVVSITGEVSSSMNTAALVSFDVPAGATAIMTAGNLSDVTVEGSMVIAQNGVVFDSLAVTGTVTAEENYGATAKKLFVGVTADDLAMAGTGDVSGVAIGTAEDSVAYVSPNATIAEDIVKNLKSTAYYIDGSLYVTAYANQTNTVKIDIDFSVENAFFDAWQYENTDGKMVDITSGDMVGTPIEEVHAKIIYEIYGVTVTADAGIGTVAIDGIVLVNQGGNVFVLNTLLSAGQHTVSYTLKSGYQGEAKLTVSAEGVTVSGMGFTLSGNPSEDATGEDMDYVVEVNLSLAGTEPGQTTVVVDNGSDSGMGLTDILLIILVVLIVVMAIMVALRLMRS